MAKSGGYAIFNCLSTNLRTYIILCDNLNIAHEDVNNFFYTKMWILSSFPRIEFMESMENHYADFSTCRPTVTICKISVSTLYHKNC